MLHYNFPPFSVGEVKFLRSPGRREIGHGALAERALVGSAAGGDGVPVHHPRRLRGPRVERLVVDGLGLRRHAGADGRRRADQGAGGRHRHGPDQGRRRGPHPLRHPGRRGSPRRHGLQGRRHGRGITALQMDIKIGGVTREIMQQALDQAREGRLHILGNDRHDRDGHAASCRCTRRASSP